MKPTLHRLPMFAVVLACVSTSACADTTNPAVVREPRWDAPRTRELAARACFDCHSHQTKWPWYASVPLVGLWVADHVDEGREKLNFSAWDTPGEDAHEAAEVVEEGEMPLSSYVSMHAEAKLTADEKAALIAGLKATLAADPPPGDPHGKKGGEAEAGRNERED